jgi:hypothetical protein
MVKFEFIDDKTNVSKQPGCGLNFGFYLILKLFRISLFEFPVLETGALVVLKAL